ncbi:MAG: hypothetical protein A2452_06220 [Candidatus Firestonebacteria bacterium RIFOXYC2_FULL_39_67]|nr:MAG: hypothetical protein A2536_00855 [Candidatus Firestonebacteria bacterium RIFOXYD2_FULL_39_29]OGF52550.1 MAG: hypothetical protein A2497_08445 [Candidatus Firestonebacteria bacterium RifOxyC12_full_39_7]OGF53818.1 MAG: hypothetical protein A2452_06220 [Candidatus Firestonebacteria bacterium RIFOXYC2_FULL_39_67]
MEEQLAKQIEEVKNRLIKEPESQVFLELSELYYKAGLKDEALSLVLSGLEKNQSYISARIFAAKLLLEMNRTKDAKLELEKVIIVDPLNLTANTMLETLYRYEGNSVAADRVKESISQMTSKEEKKGNMETSTVAEIYVTQGLVDDAINIYERIALNNPLDVKINNRLKELRKKKEEQYQEFLKKRQKIIKTIQKLQEGLKEMQEALQNLEKDL